MTARIFITGGNGLLGSTIRELLDSQNIDYRAPGVDFNITDPAKVHNELVANGQRYDVVIHCAALVDVDVCEANPGATYDINTRGTALLAEACRHTGTPMVFLSSDYVFGGKKDLISEWEDKNPVNVYGMSKSCAEEIVQYFLPGKHAIIRTAGLYGKSNKGYISYALDVMLNGKLEDGVFKAPTHRTFQPTSATQLAFMVMETAAALHVGEFEPGIYHGTCSGGATHMDVAHMIAQYLNANGSEITVTRDTTWVDKTRRPMVSMLGKAAWANTDIDDLIEWQHALIHDLPFLIENMKENKR